MKVHAVVYERAPGPTILCLECLQKLSVAPDSPCVTPIPAESEWDYYPVCFFCQTPADYVGLTGDGVRYTLSG